CEIQRVHRALRIRHCRSEESLFGRLSLTKANPSEAAQEPDRVTNAPRHHLGCEPEHDSAGLLLRITLPPRASPTAPQPLSGPADVVRHSDDSLCAREELELPVPTRLWT